MLIKYGYEVRGAPNGPTALKAARLVPPDLILLDIMMPKMDGYEVCQQLKADERTHDIPIIFISAIDETIDKVKAFSIGGVDYITKPFQAEEVLVRVKTHLTLRNLQTKLQETNDKLEIRVKERTAALTQINKKLTREIIERKRLEDRLAAIYQLGQELTLLRDESTIIQRVLETIIKVLQVELAGYGLVDESFNKLTYHYLVGTSPQKKLLHLSLDENKGICVATVRSGQAINLADITQDPCYLPLPEYSAHGSLLCVPIKNGKQVIGVLSAESRTPNYFTLDDQQLLQTLADQTIVTLENARLYQTKQEQLRRLKQSQAQLIQAEKMAALGRLGSSIAHEINNPLQAVQTCLTLIEEEVEEQRRPEKLEHYAGIARDEIERITTIIRRMRDFYRPVHRDQSQASDLDSFYSMKPGDLQLIDLHTVLDNLLLLTNKHLQNTGITVKREWADHLPMIQGNPDYLKQVFLNLVLNANDAMAGQGGTLYVRTALDQAALHSNHPQPVLRIEFSDTGEGVPPEILPRLFEPLLTTKEQGSGLGLFTSYKIIEAHQGQITAESQVGIGTTFTILFPIKQSQNQG
jgi:signal transduction histidine kinase/DNA-binding response OmpR family regulator